MNNPFQQQQQQCPRLIQPSISLRWNSVNRVNYPQLNQQQMIRNEQYVVYVGPVQRQHQLPQQQVQQQQKFVPKLGEDEKVINIAGQPPLTTDMLAYKENFKFSNVLIKDNDILNKNNQNYKQITKI